MGPIACWFNNFVESVTVTNPSFDVFCGFIFIFAHLFVANIKIKKGQTTSEKTWLIHLTQNSCTVWMARLLVMRFMSSLRVFQSYRDNGRLIMIGCVQSNSVYLFTV